MTVSENPKLAILKKHLLENNTKKALMIATKGGIYYGSDNVVKKDAQLAIECLSNPSFYASIGTDIELTVSKAIEGLKSKFL